ncbi:hypothetical protein BDY19DRAFT_1057064 [Irpex rosettiformis]|uniref:Uncharacterized protein n=1 Tax=Irpex rosettiformis TaxID=378272 RepID=A0ACB8U431_9APHY|nr:hypothetical protein BDY19DRAFT_1057064 [Irpex rosettiformis]
MSCVLPLFSLCLSVMVHELRRVLEAATALHTLLSAAGVPHAFYGGFMIALLANSPQCDEIFCIVDGETAHPFRRVRQACASSEQVTIRASPWTNRLHAVYTKLIPPIDIEILPAGEEGPRRLDSTTVMNVASVPILTISEFLRAKIKAWVLRRLENDANDIVFALSHYWNQVDINRIPEQEMPDFIARYPSAGPAWAELKRKYRTNLRLLVL